MSRLSRLLNSSAEQWRLTTVDDGGGGQSETWTLVATPRVRISQPWARDRMSADQQGSLLTHVLYTEPGTDVRRDDQFRRAGVRFDVLAVFEPSASDVYTRADCTSQQTDPREV